MNTPKFLQTDSYKAGHFDMYPEAKKMVAYGEFRKPYPGMTDKRIVFYGIRYIVEKYLNVRWTQEDLDAAEAFYREHNAGGTAYPFPRDLFEKIIAEHDGYLPITLEALPEGSVIYPHVPVYQITAEGEFSRLVTFMETLLTHVWYPTTVATLSRFTRERIQQAFDQSVEPAFHWLLASRLHDFGYRGVSCEEQAIIGGMAHLLSFDGTDTMTAAWQSQQLTANKKLFAQSIPATEHSVMMSWPTELDAILNMVEKFGHGVFATVADTYDYDNFLNNILPIVAPLVKAKGGLHVVRPDSGEPVECVLKGLRACERAYGCTINSLGYKVLNNSAVIQGDGIDYQIVDKILTAALAQGYSAQNIAFGMGAGLLHKHNRDTLSFATKLSHITYADGTERDIMKMPTGDSGKYSLPGILAVHPWMGMAKVYPASPTWHDAVVGPNLLKVVYDHGPVPDAFDDFDTIKNRIHLNWSDAARAPINFDPISPELHDKIVTTSTNIRNRAS